MKLIYLNIWKYEDFISEKEIKFFCERNKIIFITYFYNLLNSSYFNQNNYKDSKIKKI